MGKFQFPSNGPSLLALWNQAKKIPLGTRVFSRVLSWAIPYTGSISPIVESLSQGKAEISMQDIKPVRNHLNSIHAIALANLGEYSTGLALTSQMPKGMRFILGSLQIDYLTKARGKLTAKASCEEVVPTEKGTQEVVSEIFNAKNVMVAKVKATWVIGTIK